MSERIKPGEHKATPEIAKVEPEMSSRLRALLETKQKRLLEDKKVPPSEEDQARWENNVSEVQIIAVMIGRRRVELRAGHSRLPPGSIIGVIGTLDGVKLPKNEAEVLFRDLQ